MKERRSDLRIWHENGIINRSNQCFVYDSCSMGCLCSFVKYKLSSRISKEAFQLFNKRQNYDCSLGLMTIDDEVRETRKQ